MSPLPINSIQPNHNGILKDDFNEIVNWDILDDNVLEEQYFSTSTEVNAIGQILMSTSPDGSVHRPILNHSGQLKKVEVQLKGGNDFKPFVLNIDYNEKGQRASVSYGNGTKTTYEYDAFNYALKRLKTSRPQNAELLQDLQYVYDPIGNISWIKDHAQQTIYFNNHQVDPIQAYSYDAFYQLKSATGREHASKNDFGSVMNQVADLPQIVEHKADGTKMQSYKREYHYDKAGNMLSSKHSPTLVSGFERQFNYNLTNNSLTKSGVGKDETKWQNYTYDLAGNTQKLAHLDSMNWNFKNELRQLKRSDIQASYQYDSEGERARKVVQKGKKKIEVRYYLGDVEVYREYALGNGQPILERESLHVKDNTQRICMIDTKTVNENGILSGVEKLHLSRYQLGNHLGSAGVELDDEARVISYEEYYPYGSSSFQSVDKTREVPIKRYRYTGMERDEESGLNYHSARYYVPWLCRWLKPDPEGTVDGLNVWRYVRGNPILFIDLTGTLLGLFIAGLVTIFVFTPTGYAHAPSPEDEKKPLPTMGPWITRALSNGAFLAGGVGVVGRGVQLIGRSGVVWGSARTGAEVVIGTGAFTAIHYGASEIDPAAGDAVEVIGVLFMYRFGGEMIPHLRPGGPKPTGRFNAGEIESFQSSVTEQIKSTEVAKANVKLSEVIPKPEGRIIKSTSEYIIYEINGVQRIRFKAKSARTLKEATEGRNDTTYAEASLNSKGEVYVHEGRHRSIGAAKGDTIGEDLGGIADHPGILDFIFNPRVSVDRGIPVKDLKIDYKQTDVSRKKADKRWEEKHGLKKTTD